jgi:hypothetical protein
LGIPGCSRSAPPALDLNPMTGAESERVRDSGWATENVYVLALKGGGRDPVGREGRLFRRSDRYDAVEHESFFHGGLLGGISKEVIIKRSTHIAALRSYMLASAETPF